MAGRSGHSAQRVVGAYGRRREGWPSKRASGVGREQRLAGRLFATVAVARPVCVESLLLAAALLRTQQAPRLALSLPALSWAFPVPLQSLALVWLQVPVTFSARLPAAPTAC